jgi:hypothetical protein
MGWRRICLDVPLEGVVTQDAASGFVSTVARHLKPSADSLDQHSGRAAAIQYLPR